MTESVNRLLVGLLAIAVLAAGAALWAGLGKPGLASAKSVTPPMPLNAAEIGDLNAVLGPDALLFEPSARDDGSTPIDEALALEAIQCDSARHRDNCRAALVATLIPSDQQARVDALAAIAHGQCRRELRRLAVVVAAAAQANAGFGEHGATSTVADEWVEVAASLSRYAGVDAQGSPVLAAGLAACAPGATLSRASTARV
jgi:hypothetical protein